MKIIRWWGLFAFIGFMLLSSLVWYLFAANFVESTIEEVGTEALGAKVEIDHVELSLFPTAITINHLQATDPDAPMQNIVETEQIKLSIDAGALLWKKIVVDEMVLTGMQTATPRQKSGELKGGRKTGQAIQSTVDAVIPDLNSINTEEVIEKADLITLKRIESLKESQSKIERQWQKNLNKESFEQRVDTIQADYNRLSQRAKENKLNLLKDRKEWKQLKRSIDTEREQIRSLSSQLKQDKKQLSEQFKSVKQGPNDDLNAIMAKLGIDNGVDGLIDKYIGPQYTPWINKVLALVKDVKPVKSENSDEAETRGIQVGKKVYFKDEHVFPEVLIKTIKLSGSNPQWSLKGDGYDLGYLPWLTGNPAKLNIDFSQGDNSESSAKLDVKSDWQSANNMLTKINSSVNQWSIDSMMLMQTEAGNWQLKSGLLNATVDASVTMESIKLTTEINITSPKVVVPEGISDWQKLLADSINDEAKISFLIRADGTLSEPNIKIDSSLEKLFSQAIGKKIKQKSEQLEVKVKKQLSEKIGDYSQLEDFQSNFSQWQSQLTNKDQLLEDLLSKIK
jgi:uncharacterized protein (TIGR03545 family)